MATKKDNAVAAEPMQSGSDTYSAEDFIAAADKLWPDKKTRPSRFLIAAAFKTSGKTAATKDEGIDLVNKFAHKKVN